MLRMGGIRNIFANSPEDGQTMIFAGSRQVTGSFPNSDDVIVDDSGSGDYQTIQAALDHLNTDAGTVRVKAGNYLITSALQFKGNNQSIIGSGKGTKIYKLRI